VLLSKRSFLQTFYRKRPDSQVHNLRAVADFACTAVEVLALAREFDLISTWNWTVQESHIVETHSDMDIVALAVVKMPWPYRNRMATVRAVGGDCLSDRACAIVYFHSDESVCSPSSWPVPHRHACDACKRITSAFLLVHGRENACCDGTSIQMMLWRTSTANR
jgi:hypothetical protein